MKNNELNENQPLREATVSSWPLSFDQAIIELLAGKKICHFYFFDWEWIQLYQPNPSMVVFEDGVKMSREKFMETYGNDTFSGNWAVFQACC